MSKRKKTRNEFFLLFLDLLEHANALAVEGKKLGDKGLVTLGLWIKIGLAVSVAAPILMVACSLFVPREDALTVMLAVALLPLFCALELIFRMDSKKLGAGAIGLGIWGRKPKIQEGIRRMPIKHESVNFFRNATVVALDAIPDLGGLIRQLRNILAGEIMFAIYLALVPLDPHGTLLWFIIFSLLIVISPNRRIRIAAGVGIAVVTVVALIIAAGISWEGAKAEAVTYVPSLKPLPADYGPMPCPLEEPRNLSLPGRLPATLHLKPGCLHGPYKLPTNIYVRYTMGNEKGNWVVPMCAGQGRPGSVVWPEEDRDGNMRHELDNCSKIFLEGMDGGTVTISQDIAMEAAHS